MKKYTGSKTQDTFFIEQFISNLCTNYFNKNNPRQEFSLTNCCKTINDNQQFEVIMNER